MSKPLMDHANWVKYQFENYLRDEYRDIFIHSSLIEGLLVEKSGMNNFSSANKFLLCSSKIEPWEFCVFDRIRRIRNKIAHEIMRKKLPEKDINQLRDNLMKRIREAYRTSKFLDQHLFKKYGITRKSIIKYEGSI